MGLGNSLGAQSIEFKGTVRILPSKFGFEALSLLLRNSYACLLRPMHLFKHPFVFLGMKRYSADLTKQVWL